jgi:hypothetical protein
MAESLSRYLENRTVFRLGDVPEGHGIYQGHQVFLWRWARDLSSLHSPEKSA